MPTTRDSDLKDIGPIVSSGHLANGALPALSEMEFALIMLSHAFDRWMVRGMAAAGVPDLSPLDVLILHNVNHRNKGKTLADICLVLNVEDTHTVAYALKKLERAKLVQSGRRGKEKLVLITDKGRDICDRYGKIREELLVKSVLSTEVSSETLSNVASRIRALSGHYDQASRAAASL
ncbi:winged helix DNA-binding protein [Agrobacterium tumefaciens]|uniref:winged helix DNA-binding protein n=1 Tax=Agrobacterium tumefaciens complex TaxID=1183400 RepID=UPI001572C23B|nr:winged helix DNA-binding protein [Agrobacterium fabrum]NSZ09683.1 winged helix DNA-binding protein [Agrobacterium tumefaciens]